MTFRIEDFDTDYMLTVDLAEGSVNIVLSDDQCSQLLNVLGSRLALPKSDAPLCPDSPDGEHHTAPVGTIEDAVLLASENCHYCGESADAPF